MQAMDMTASTFPTHYQHHDRGLLLQVYAAGPDRVEAAVAGLTLEQLRERPIPGKWSIAEIVHHLADSEAVGAVRFRKVIAEPGSPLPGYSEAVWAERMDYQGRGEAALDDTLRWFRAMRRVATALFESASEPQWNAAGRHVEWGMVTLRQLLDLYADHSERHIEQISARRSMLGVPAALPPTQLPVRLY